MKFYLIGNKETGNDVLDNLVMELEEVFPEIDGRDFPITFVKGGRYNGQNTPRPFADRGSLERYCIDKPQWTLDATPFVSVEGTAYRNLSSAIAELTQRRRAPLDRNIILAHQNYVVLQAGQAPHFTLREAHATHVEYNEQHKAFILGCDNVVLSNHTKRLAFAIAMQLHVERGQIPQTAYCVNVLPNKEGLCIMYGDHELGIASTQKELDARGLGFCEPCTVKLGEAAKHYL